MCLFSINLRGLGDNKKTLSPIHSAFDPDDVIIGFEYGLQGSFLQ